MTYKFCPLSQKYFEQYDDFLSCVSGNLLYYTRKYRDFLHRVLNNVESEYFLAINDTKVEAILPLFVQHGPMGSVVNSLPYYGSHGGILAHQNCSPLAVNGLKNCFDQFCLNHNAISSTIIENPYGCPINEVNLLTGDFGDSRIGQLTELPHNVTDAEQETSLMSMFHSKTRNMVRKGIKAGFELTIDNRLDAFCELYRLHEENMLAIGGKAKEFTTFKTIRELFTPDKEFNLYLASKNEETAAALLLLYSGDTVEYFTPVIAAKYRSDQPLSALIFKAMTEASQAGFKHWNWGGTWLSQENVYRFKSRWGAKDKKYAYHTKVYGKLADIMNSRKSDLLSMYPDFYVVPFSELKD